MPHIREQISWFRLQLGLVIARFCDPQGEIYLAEHCYERTTFADLLDIAVTKIYDNRLHQVLDKLLPHMEDLEQQLLMQDWHTIQPSLEVQSYVSPFGDKERIILCRSIDRREKEQAIFQHFYHHIEIGFEKIQNSCDMAI